MELNFSMSLFLLSIKKESFSSEGEESLLIEEEVALHAVFEWASLLASISFMVKIHLLYLFVSSVYVSLILREKQSLALILLTVLYLFISSRLLLSFIHLFYLLKL